MSIENVNPLLFSKASDREVTAGEQDESVVDEIDDREVFDLLRNITDPEHPLTLEQLHVIEQENITVGSNSVVIQFTPTIPNCSLSPSSVCPSASSLRALPPRFKTQVLVTPGSHSAEHAINKQLNDKERIAAALENTHLLKVINQCIA